MPEDSERLSGAEEYIAAEIELAAEIGPAEEKAIRSAIEKTKGLRFDSLGIENKRVSIYYDPTRITKEELTGLITRTGAKPGQVQTERSPLL
jgi:hypothetical protein